MSDPRPSDSAAPPRVSAWLWVGVLGPPLLWFAAFQAVYGLVPWLCQGRFRVATPLTMAVTAVAVIVVAWIAQGCHRRFTQLPATDENRRSRFMARLGLMMSALFALLVAAQGLAFAFIDPCKM